MLRPTLVVFAAVGVMIALNVADPSPAHAVTAKFAKLCEDEKIALPGVLPDTAKCHDKDKTGCANWKFIKEFTVAASEKDSGLVRKFQPKTDSGARLYQWPEKRKDTDKTSTVCWYLFRGIGGGLGNGTLCFNDKCQVCALDSKVLNAEWKNLEGIDQLGNNRPENCWQCHAAGTIAPKKKYYDAIKGTEMPQMNGICAGNSFGKKDDLKYGPEWIGAPNAWESDATWNKSKKIAAEPPCDDCHKAFIQTHYTKKDGTHTNLGSPPFCIYIAEKAFGDGGAMKAIKADDHTFTFPSKDKCETFARSMGCEPSQFHCPTR
jgi:hypothetical protein